MTVQIRADLKEDYVFSTEDGVLIDNNVVYTAKYDDDQMLILINGEYRKVMGIDFDIN